MRNLALAALAAATALCAGAPALAQVYDRGSVDELTVTGRLPGQRAYSLSEAVSYADLDLTRYSDRETLRLRVNDTARRICTRLNQESPNRANMGHSCQENAVRGAMDQVRYAFADAREQAYVDEYGAPVSARVPDYEHPYTPDPDAPN